MIDNNTVHIVSTARANLVSPDYGKFVEADIERSAPLRDATISFLENYGGNFGFLLDLKDKHIKYNSLSGRQLAAAANCLWNDIERQEKKKAQDASAPVGLSSSTPKIPNGTFTVVREDGVRNTLKLEDTFRENNLGEQVISYLGGPDNEHDYVSFAFVRGDQVSMFRKFGDNENLKNFAKMLLADKEEARKMGLAYARESSNCFVCGRKLTTPESIEAGIGPVCEGRWV